MVDTTALGDDAGTRQQRLQNLYDRHRYLDAYALSADHWTASTDVRQLSVDETILGARLAVRLGGQRLSRWLLRTALQREPSNPRVRFFTRDLRGPRWRLLDELRALETDPDVGGDDAEIRAAWYASSAFGWAFLRDFERAYRCLQRAHEVVPNDAWVLTCESGVHGMNDRWADALASAERAWEIDPGAPFAAASLGTSLLNLGRVEEAASRLYAASETSQSCDLVVGACWHQCALAETLNTPERRRALERAALLADRMPALAPLADRESRLRFARARLDVAALSDDYEGMERWCEESRSPFHRQLLANLRKNGSGERLRLPFRRTIQTHEACVPASIAAAMSAGGIVVSAEEMASEITFGGTPQWAAAAWLRARGFHVRFFAVTREIAARLIGHHIAFVLVWDAEDAGHAVAIVGVDERAETLLVHDPQSFRSTEYLMAVLDAGLSPLGVKGMAAVASDRAAVLDALLPPESALMEAAEEHQRVLVALGPSAARPIVADAIQRFPSHPGAHFLEAAQSLEDGHAGAALKQLLPLLQRFPNAPIVRVRVLAACHALGNTARFREALQDIVERGLLPGLQAEQEWIRPPARYVYEYADLLRLSSATRERAERLLHALLRRHSACAGAWHALADLLAQKRDVEGALLCHRLASHVAPDNEHYALAYADALGGRREEDKAFQFLESRARARASSPNAVGTWTSWIGMLEERGYPERALAVCSEALQRHPHSVDLLAFAVPFFARMGLWEMAEERLVTLKSAGRPAAFHQASVLFLKMRGDLDAAIEHADAWIAEAPQAMDARRAMLQLLTGRDGPDAAVQRATEWMHANRDHEGFEEAYCAQLDRAGSPRWKKIRVLRRRLLRNREDASAWIELTFTCLLEQSIANERRRPRIERRIEQFLAECDRTCSGSVPALRLHALWREERGEWAQAVDTWLECIERDPATFISYERAWQSAARLPDAERRRVWAAMRRPLLNAPGRLSIARPMMALLVERFGLEEAEKEIEQWRIARPDDPDVLEAAADLLIEHGHGITDARRAVAIVVPAVQRYPYHPGLRFSLASAYRRAGEVAEAENVFLEIVRRHPTNPAAHIQLAWTRQARGDQEGAYRTLDAAQAYEPQVPEIVAARAQILLANSRTDDARRCIEQGLARMPRNVQWRHWAIALFEQCRAHDQAIAAAREGVSIYPRGAFLWFLLGKTLTDMRRYAATGEIEACFRRSLTLNPALFESAEGLSGWLAEQERYDEAIEVMGTLERRLADPSRARGWQAFIKRRQGLKVEARQEMTAVVSAAPWFGWGWRVLADWLDEDEAWEDAHRLLGEVPAQMRTDTAFRRRRLLLLRKAAVPQAQIDAEWNDLVRDFPDDPAVRAGLSEPKVPTGVNAAGNRPGSTVPWWAWWLVAIALFRLLAYLMSS